VSFITHIKYNSCRLLHLLVTKRSLNEDKYRRCCLALVYTEAKSESRGTNSNDSSL